MYVCVCKGITDNHIRREVEGGARTMRDLNQRLGVCSQCGRCGKCAKSVLSESLGSGSEAALAAAPA